MSKSKEIEWTILFDFPNSNAKQFSYYPTNAGDFNVIEHKNDFTWSDCRVWSNKKEAKAFAIEKAGKYGWKFFPTKILVSMEDEAYKESLTFTDDDFYR